MCEMQLGEMPSHKQTIPCTLLFYLTPAPVQVQSVYLLVLCLVYTKATAI